jgi:hypothetical protein
MSALQIMAAGLVGLERLVFHTGAPGGDAQLAEAQTSLETLLGDRGRPLDEAVEGLADAGYRWGVSNGT